MVRLFLDIFIPLFIIVNPWSTIPMFSVFTYAYSRKERKLAARKTVMNAALLLIIFAIAGSGILSYLGIKIYSLRIAGGILLSFVGLDMVRKGRQYGEGGGAGGQKPDFTVVPIAMPSLAGPGAITVTIVSMTTLHGSAESLGISLIPPWVLLLLLAIAAIVLTMAITYFILLSSEIVIRILGERGMDAFTRIMGLLIVAIAVQFVLNGLDGWIEESGV